MDTLEVRSHKLHAIGVAHDRCRQALTDYKRETMTAVNFMLREVSFSLKRQLKGHKLDVLFGDCGGSPVIRLDGRDLHITPEGMKDDELRVYPELTELAAAITTAETLTLMYTLGKPHDLRY